VLGIKKTFTLGIQKIFVLGFFKKTIKKTIKK